MVTRNNASLKERWLAVCSSHGCASISGLLVTPTCGLPPTLSICMLPHAGRRNHRKGSCPEPGVFKKRGGGEQKKNISCMFLLVIYMRLSNCEWAQCMGRALLCPSGDGRRAPEAGGEVVGRWWLPLVTATLVPYRTTVFSPPTLHLYT